MNTKTSLVITSISEPNKVIKLFAEKCKENDIDFILIGDKKSPPDFYIPNCNFFDYNKQNKLNFKLAKELPFNHYSRKNIGYLLAIKNKTEIIIETDDDNTPLETFWQDYQREKQGVFTEKNGWFNVYNYFSDKKIWPRGYPIELVNEGKVVIQEKIIKKDCPIQQGLANKNPDIDAIYRLVMELPVDFDNKKPIILDENTWCPFNSQNTIWFKEAFPLLYLPSFCSFRMTDIWRSFVAQRIAWTCDWNLVFFSPTVYQERNEHNLLSDFKQEISGYLNNSEIVNKLNELELKTGVDAIPENLIKCYNTLIDMNLVEKQEIVLLKAWLHDIKGLLND